MMLLWRTRDALAKLGQPLSKIQESVKNTGGKEKSFPVGTGYGVKWLCWVIITSDEPSAPTLPKMLPQGFWALALISPLCEGLMGMAVLCRAVSDRYNQFPKFLRANSLYFQLLLYCYFVTMSLHNAPGGACWSLEAGCNGNHGKS